MQYRRHMSESKQLPDGTEGLIFREDAQHRSEFFSERADVGRLLEMVTALTGEIAILRARLDTHERLAASGSGFDHARVEAYRAPSDVLAYRMQQDQEMIARVFRAVTEEIDRLASDADVRKVLMEKKA